MNVQQQNYSTTNVTSQHFINNLDTIIIHLTQAFSIEHQILPDPDAKSMTRKVIQERLNILLTKEEKEQIKELVALVRNKDIGNNRNKIYNVIKILGLDYVK